MTNKVSIGIFLFFKKKIIPLIFTFTLAFLDGADGGAYFTDSLAAAAQHACYSTTYDSWQPVPEVVYVACE